MTQPIAERRYDIDWLLPVNSRRVGFAGFYLNRPSQLLSYTNPAILPWYMLHQTLIIVFAWMLKPLAR